MFASDANLVFTDVNGTVLDLKMEQIILSVY